MSIRPQAVPLSVAELDAWRGLLRAHSALTKTLDAELETDHALPLSSYEVLLALDAAGERRMRMCDLAASVLLSRSGLTRLIDRLEREGLVARDSCEHDARGSFAVLTDVGAQRLCSARATYIDGIRRHFLSHFSDAELAALGGLLGRLADEGSTAAPGDAG